MWIRPLLDRCRWGGLVPYIIVKKVKVKEATAEGYAEIGVGGGDVGGIP